MNKTQLLVASFRGLPFCPFFLNMGSTGRHDRAVSQWLFRMAMGRLVTARAVICE